MAIVFNMGSQARLAESVETGDTRILLTSYDTMLAKGGSNDSFYARLVNAEGDLEIVLVDVGNSDSVQGLSVTRGVEATSAKAWGQGTVIWQVLSESSIEPLSQKAVYRQVAYIPDGTLVSDYFGEKVYQSNLQLWWKAVASATTEWRLIAGKIYTADVVFYPSAGEHYEGTTLTMSCTTPGSAIYYTTDGTTPDETDTLYTAPITLPDPGPTTYKARAFGDECYQSPSENITSGDYTTTPFNVVFQELFEQTGALYDGYDVPGWSETESANGEVNANALSSVVGSPTGWGTECLKITFPLIEHQSNRTSSPFFTTPSSIYVRFEVVFTSITLPSNLDEIEIFRLRKVSEAYNFRLFLHRDSGGVNRFKMYLKTALSDPVSLDTVYRIEVHQGVDGWEWRVNGVTIDTSTGATADYSGIGLGAWDGSSFDDNYVAYFDRLTVSDTYWIGA